MDEIIAMCRLSTCTNTFVKKVHNQTFCSRECCRVFTNARILAQYHEKKNKVMKGRVCGDKSCNTLLSRYNDGEYCSVHEAKRQAEKLRGWGWEVNEDGEIVR